MTSQHLVRSRGSPPCRLTHSFRRPFAHYLPRDFPGFLYLLLLGSYWFNHQQNSIRIFQFSYLGAEEASCGLPFHGQLGAISGTLRTLPEPQTFCIAAHAPCVMDVACHA